MLLSALKLSCQRGCIRRLLFFLSFRLGVIAFFVRKMSSVPKPMAPAKDESSPLVGSDVEAAGGGRRARGIDIGGFCTMPLLFAQILVLVLYVTLNSGLNYFNKWALSDSGAGFNFPALYTMFHAIGTVSASLLTLVIVPAWRTISIAQLRSRWMALMAISLAFATSLYANNASLHYLGLSENQVIKSCLTVPTMLLSMLIEGKRYSWQLGAVVVIMTVFACLTVPFDSPSSTPLGICLAFISLLCTSVKFALSGLVMKGAKDEGFYPVVVTFYDGAFSFWWLLTLWLANPVEREPSLAFLREHPSLAIGIITAGTLMASTYNIVSMSLMYLTDSTTLSACAVACKVLTIVVSFCFIEHDGTPLNYVFMVLFCLALVLYTYMKAQGR
jgi:drug/metabolite transporter (DMT)-like permease